MAPEQQRRPHVVDVSPAATLPAALEYDTAAPFVVLYLHGGAFLFDETADVSATRLCTALSAPVALPHYRIGDQSPYPAASDDVLHAYELLLGSGWTPGRVLVVGHSAGATLALNLQLRLNDSSQPHPLGVVALSGVLDFTLTSDSIRQNDGLDRITRQQAEQVTAAYTGGADPDDPMISPARAKAERWTGAAPLFLLCGGHEIFRDDTLQLAVRAASGGADVTLRVIPGQQHGFAQRAIPASDRILEEIAAFADRCAHPLPAEQDWSGPMHWDTPDDQEMT